MIYPGHGAKSRPQHLKIKDRIAGASPFDWSTVKEDSIGVIPNLFGIPDKDQGGSLSCTCQVTGYGFKYSTGIEISREDVYSRVALPGGGAYLNSPLDFLKKTGLASLDKYPDPYPETEANMTKVVAVQDGDRIKIFKITYTFYPTDISSTASAITNHNYIHLGIKGSWVKGWESSWVDPYFGQDDWEHALFAGKESIVLRKGIPTIKAKSSWCEHSDPQGQRVYCHYLNKNYFDTGGIFEVIGVDIAEINMFKLVQVSGSPEVWIVKDNKKTHVYNAGALTTVSDFSQIQVISQADLNAIPDSGLELASLVKE